MVIKHSDKIKTFFPLTLVTCTILRKWAEAFPELIEWQDQNVSSDSKNKRKNPSARDVRSLMVSMNRLLDHVFILI